MRWVFSITYATGSVPRRMTTTTTTTTTMIGRTAGPPVAVTSARPRASLVTRVVPRRRASRCTHAPAGQWRSSRARIPTHGPTRREPGTTKTTTVRPPRRFVTIVDMQRVSESTRRASATSAGTDTKTTRRTRRPPSRRAASRFSATLREAIRRETSVSDSAPEQLGKASSVRYQARLL